MIYAKSVLAGAVIAFIAWFLSALFYAYVVVAPRAQVRGHTSVGIDVRVFLQPLFLAVALLGFAIGFYWELRRA
jgi:hypothetical protein